MDIKKLSNVERTEIRKQYNNIRFWIKEKPAEEKEFWKGYLEAFHDLFGQEMFEPQFSYPCSISNIDITEDLHDFLKDLGYTVNVDLTLSQHNLYCNKNVVTNYMEEHVSYRCCENIEQFKAMAAIRDDSDYMQWFFQPHINKWQLSTSSFSPTYVSAFIWKKAEPDDIFAHFCNK